jgi:hypothetical protein
MKPSPSSIQSTTSPFTVPLKLSTKQFMQRQEQRHISLGRGQTINAITHGRRHRLHQDNHPRITTYYTDSTLYPIPEHGSGGLLYSIYHPIQAYKTYCVWQTIDEFNHQPPHHRRILAKVDYFGVIQIGKTKPSRRLYN